MHVQGVETQALSTRGQADVFNVHHPHLDRPADLSRVAREVSRVPALQHDVVHDVEPGEETHGDLTHK